MVILPESTPLDSAVFIPNTSLVSSTSVWSFYLTSPAAAAAAVGEQA